MDDLFVPIMSFLLSLIGWMIIYSISILNATRSEIKEMLKDYNTQINLMTVSAFEFWTNLSSENFDTKVWAWRYQSEKQVSNLRRLRKEILDIFNINLDDDSEFHSFLEHAQNEMPDDQLKLLIKDGIKVDFKKTVGPKLTSLKSSAEILNARSWKVFYSKFPYLKGSVNLTSIVLKILICLLLVIPALLFFFFLFYSAFKYV